MHAHAENVESEQKAQRKKEKRDEEEKSIE